MTTLRFRPAVGCTYIRHKFWAGIPSTIKSEATPRSSQLRGSGPTPQSHLSLSTSCSSRVDEFGPIPKRSAKETPKATANAACGNTVASARDAPPRMRDERAHASDTKRLP